MYWYGVFRPADRAHQILPGARRPAGLANPLMPGETGLTGDAPEGSHTAGRDTLGAALLRLGTLGYEAAGMANDRAPTEFTAGPSQRGYLTAAGQTRKSGNLRHSRAGRPAA
jgi:hypothetical protein